MLILSSEKPLPQYRASDGEDPYRDALRLANEGLLRKHGPDVPDVYRERLQTELES